MSQAASSSRQRIAVIGLGSIGSMTLMHLARAGFSTTGFEQFRIGHDLGASGGPSRLFRMLYGEGVAYIPMLMRARQLWADLETRAGRRLFYGGGAFTLGDESSGWIASLLDGAARYDLPVRVYSAAELARQYPNYRLRDNEVGVLDPNGGIVATRQAIHGAVQDACSHGAEVLERTAVTAIDTGGDSVSVTAGGRSFAFDRVVVCSGPWIRSLLPDLAVSVAKVSCTLHMATERPLSSFDLPSAMYMRDGQVAWSCQPMPDGEHVKFFVGGSEPAGMAAWTSPEAWSDGPVPVEQMPVALASVSDDYLARTTAALGGALTGVSPAVVSASAYYDAVTPDGHALLGALPDDPRIVIAGGMSLHGFKLAPIFGEMAARLVKGEATTDEFETFNPARFGTPESRQPRKRAF